MKYTIQQFHNDFPNDSACLLYLFKKRFPYAKCSKCEKTKFYKHPTRACFTCPCGSTHLFPKMNTIFEKSSTDLVKWFFAIFLMSQSRNGVAAKEIERHTGVTYKCAWRMARQIRSLMAEDGWVLHGKIEADETVIGGKIKGWANRNKNKSVVLGAVEKDGRAKLIVIKNRSGRTINKALKDNIAKGSELNTDGLAAYKKAAEIIGAQHNRQKNTNTIEGLFGQLKRSLDGTYHVISPKYLPLYLQEFQFRYNYGRCGVHLFDALLGRV